MRLSEYILLALGSLFVILDPIAVVPAFIAMTPQDTPAVKLRMARLACCVAAGVLMIFAAAGPVIFKVMGITLPAFQIAGSILLLRIALDMLYAKRSPARETEEEVAAGAAKDDIAITPLGVPMLAGPGSISTALILLNQAAWFFPGDGAVCRDCGASALPATGFFGWRCAGRIISTRWR